MTDAEPERKSRTGQALIPSKTLKLISTSVKVYRLISAKINGFWVDRVYNAPKPAEALNPN